MRITVCELPHSMHELEAAWRSLCEHTIGERSELLLLPEFAFVEPVWMTERFDAKCWIDVVSRSEQWLSRFRELDVSYVIGARPISIGSNRYNEGFLWSRESGYRALRRKYYLPNEPGGWEAEWFARGDWKFPSFAAGALSFGLNICTELWSLESYGAYASLGIHAIFSPRATAAATTNKWLSMGTVAAVRSGAYCLSSNRTHVDGSCGGVGWIISPDGQILSATSKQSPFSTADLDLNAAAISRLTYPRYIFEI